MADRFSKIQWDPRFKGNKKQNNEEEEEDSRFVLKKDEQEDSSASSSDQEQQISEESSSEGSDSEIEENIPSFEEEEVDEIEEPTKRLAAQNLDWDRIRAQDILALLQSFVGSGSILSVTVYPSEFGTEQMAKENTNGPDLWDSDKSNNNDEGFDSNKLRKYELERLKYYFAVIICDSVETSSGIYENCDGLEFELSGNLLDLRYIPDDIEFKAAPRESVTEIPETYDKPPSYFTRAVQHTKPGFSWDKTAESRLRVTGKRYETIEEIEKNNFQDFLETDSESESGSEDNETNKEEKNKRREEMRMKLLSGLDQSDEEDEDSSSEHEEMTITFTTGLSEKTQNLLDKKKDSKNNEDTTVFEKQRQKQKEKKKLRKKERKDKVQEKIEEKNQKLKNIKESKKKKKKNGKNKKLTEEEKKQEAELELIALGDEEKKKGYSLNNLLKQNENKKKSKKKKNKKDNNNNEEEEEEDNFQIDTTGRWGKLMTSQHFALDRTSSNFKKTKQMETVLKKMQQERNQPEKQIEEEKENLDDLVKNLKRKVSNSNFKQSKNKKRKTK